jgi:hypothetical protein
MNSGEPVYFVKQFGLRRSFGLFLSLTLTMLPQPLKNKTARININNCKRGFLFDITDL